MCRFRLAAAYAFACSLLASPLTAQIGDRSAADQSAPPAHWKIGDAPVRTPAESMQLIDLPPGFRVELVAAEPLVEDPTAIRFDERGRLWVLEWPDYNKLLRGVIPGTEDISPPQSRVVILEDLDGDGRMDRRTVFMDGIEWLRGLELVGDGALVLKLPRIVAARDTDGDGKADEEIILADGLEIPANPHAAQSNLLRAMDNWIYGSKFPRRLRPEGDTWLEKPHLSMRGQWGFSQDNFGRFVYASNGDHLRGDLVPGHYYTRNPNYPGTAGTDVRYPSDQTTWPHAATPGTNRRNQQRDEDGTLKIFTANTGPTVYRGDQFPPEYVGNVFLGEAAGRFVRRSVLTEADGMITAENAYERREFLFSHDERFRPVYTANGPDGALYVADMYRGILEGHLFVTSYLRKQILERGLQRPFHGLGRIYRIVHTGRTPAAPPRFERSDAMGWVEHLAHPNGFWRDTTQRLLVERGDRRAVPALRKMAREHPGELARLHALWTLEGLGAIEPEILTPALSDSSFRIRQAAIRLAEPFLLDRDFASKVIALLNDDRIEVRRQLVFSLGEGRGRALEDAMLRVLQRDIDDPIMLDAALSGLHGRELAVLERVANEQSWAIKQPGSVRLLGALAQAVVNSGRDPDIVRLLEHIAGAAGRELWIRHAVLDGMVSGKNRGLARFQTSLTALEKSSDEGVRQRATDLRKSWMLPVAAPVVANSAGLAGPVFIKGQNVYAVCAACHGPEGKGQPGVAPPLVESPVIAGAPEVLIRTILLGGNQNRSGSIFPDMPPLAGLGDDDIAAVASYVRARWIGYNRPITAEQVRRIRTETVAPPAAAAR